MQVTDNLSFQAWLATFTALCGVSLRSVKNNPALLKFSAKFVSYFILLFYFGLCLNGSSLTAVF